MSMRESSAASSTRRWRWKRWYGVPTRTSPPVVLPRKNRRGWRCRQARLSGAPGRHASVSRPKPWEQG